MILRVFFGRQQLLQLAETAPQRQRRAGPGVREVPLVPPLAGEFAYIAFHATCRGMPTHARSVLY